MVIQSAYNAAWDVYDVLHLAASDSSGAGTYRAYRAAGAAANPALNQDAGKTYIIGSFDELSDFLDEPYTLRIGRFDIDDEGYLVYYDRKFDPAADPDTFRIFHIRFFGLPTRKLSDDACGLMRCPDICWRWVKRPDPDWSNVDTIAPPPCEETALLRIRSAINKSIDECIDEDLHNLKQQYELSCGDPKNLDEVITIQYPVDYIHFSLYYYDRAGRLVRTVPPKGVDVLGPTATRMDSPDHTYVTEYRYNSLGQLVQTESPDGGMSRFWYDRVGRLRFSQDARLAARGEYAYTKFDDIGRVVEFGVSDDSASFTAFAGSHNVEDPDFPPTGSERTYLAYDSVPSVITYLDGTKQTFLRNRVRKVWTDDTVVTHFSYDVHGNIVWTAQEIPGFPRKNYTKYEYDLISGNVNQVLYNEGRVDEFRHRYTYDADNALVRVETSHDGVIWDTDARYEYYSHGRLRRAEIGEDKLQGLDYTWTIDGRLKAINHPALQFGADPGKDGKSHHGHQAFAADSFAVMLHYHGDDFIAAGSTPFNSGGSDDLAPVPQYDGNIAGMETHVGKKAGGTQKYEERTGESYRYDPLGRLDSSRFHTWNSGSGSWNAHGQEYLTTYEYDANGNITKLIRHSYTQSGSTQMDSLTYHYKAGQTNRIDYVFDAVPGDPHSEDLENTQSAGNYEYDPVGNLTQDNDEGGMTVEWSAYGKVKEIDRDIPMPSPVAAEEITYTYDAGGNRVRKRVQTSTGTGGVEIDETFYVHDAGGVVVAIYEKYCDDDLVVPPPPGGGPDSDFDGWPDVTDNCKTTPNPDQRDSDGDGVGDACDNCTCKPNPDQIDANSNTQGDACEADHPTDPDGDSYPADHDNCPCSFNPNQEDTDGDGYGDSCDVCAVHLVELPIYGLGRLGVSKPDIDIDNELPPDDTFTRRLNEKHYELADHLGNVRAVLGDRKLTATPGAGNYYGDIRSYSHPYPFGMPQPGRNWDRSGDTLYRYGYNGMETDGEVKEERGNHYTTYFRQYDPRLGRWWSNDPVVQPGESPYAAMYNNPILFSDPMGNDPGDPTGEGSGTEPIMPGGGSGTEPQQPQPPIRDDPISRRSLVSVYYNDGFPYEGDGSEHLLGPSDTWMYRQDERSAIRAVIVTTHQSGDISVFQFDRWRRWWYRIYTGPVSEANLMSARPPYSLYDEMANNTFVILFTMIPVAGDVMDLALGVIAAVEGRWADAVLGHFIYFVPFTDLFKIFKLVKTAKNLENGTDAIKVFENSTEIAEGRKLAEMSQGSVGKGEGVAGPSREELANLPQVKTDNSAQTSGTVTGAQLLENTAARGFAVNQSKFDYFFGRVVSGSEHNITRSAQNLKDLQRTP